MIVVKKEGILLEKTLHEFEEEGVTNPAVIREGNNVHVLYRAISKGNFSSIGYCLLHGPLSLSTRNTHELISPQNTFESHGIEDPRIVFFEDTYYLTYTAYDGVNALGALMVSRNLRQFTSMGIIVPCLTYEDFTHFENHNEPIYKRYFAYHDKRETRETQGKSIFLWDKNVILFPRRINGKIYFLHRIRPDIQLVCVDKFEDLTPEFWRDYFLQFNKWVFLVPIYAHEKSYVGGGCPPIETSEGWLIIYHGVHDSVNGNVYVTCAALFDIENPIQELARLPYPLFQPDEQWEQKGNVNNVCFSTGAVVFDDRLYIYYGAADERIATASISLKELLSELLFFKKANNKTYVKG